MKKILSVLLGTIHSVAFATSFAEELKSDELPVAADNSS